MKVIRGVQIFHEQIFAGDDFLGFSRDVLGFSRDDLRFSLTCLPFFGSSSTCLSRAPQAEDKILLWHPNKQILWPKHVLL